MQLSIYGNWGAYNISHKITIQLKTYIISHVTSYIHKASPLQFKNQLINLIFFNKLLNNLNNNCKYYYLLLFTFEWNEKNMFHSLVTGLTG